jgi:hypothetical protein
LHRWVVTDLQSMHGMYVRVSRTVLADTAEFLVGNGRYRFDAPQLDPNTTSDYAPAGQLSGETRGWDDGASPFRPPALSELIGAEIGNRILLVQPEYWIGSDPSCPICRPDDPFCESRHVRVYRKPKGGWYAEHNKTPNGLWLRMPQLTVESMAQFQIGEQRFQLKVSVAGSAKRYFHHKVTETTARRSRSRNCLIRDRGSALMQRNFIPSRISVRIFEFDKSRASETP